MASIDEIIAQLVGAKKATADNTLLEQLNQIKSAENTENTQYQQAKPKFQENRNQANSEAWADMQATNERLAGMGNYRSGSAIGKFTTLLNRANSQRKQIDTQEGQFETSHLQKLNDLLDKRNQAEALKTQAYGLADQEGAAERAKYEMQQATARRTSSGGSGGRSLTASQSALQSAYEWVDNLADQGDTIQDALAKLNGIAPEFIRDQVDPKKVEKYLYAKFNAPQGAGTGYSSSIAYANGAMGGRTMGGYVPR